MAHAFALSATPSATRRVRLTRRTHMISHTRSGRTVRRAEGGESSVPEPTPTPEAVPLTPTPPPVPPPLPPPVPVPAIEPPPVPMPPPVAATESVTETIAVPTVETAMPARPALPEKPETNDVHPINEVESPETTTPTTPTPTKSPSRGARPILGRLALCRNDPSLAPYEGLLKERYDLHESRENEIIKNEGSLQKFASSYKEYGLHPSDPKKSGYKKGDVTYVEYAPGAKKLSLMGDFNKWVPWEFEGVVDEFGKWTVEIPESAGLKHGSFVRVAMEDSDGNYFDRIPAWITMVAPCLDETANYHNGVYYDPPDEHKYKWKHAGVVNDKNERAGIDSLKIYEAHVGMSSEEHRYGKYKEFADTHLDRIANLGYNTLQLMAIADHAYYASFGYQVTNFFAPAHRSGSPEDLKYLIDKAHGLGLCVLMDVVHAHASDNTIDGLNHFDGTDGGYFHSDPGRGWHSLWGTRMFNYGSYETLRFLLSNLKYWTDEFKFDGFRFDGVTAMLYTHRGIHWNFIGGKDEFFGFHADNDACSYLMLGNKMLREEEEGKNKKHIITIAEEVSGQTGVCRPVWHGGLGFDLRLSMGPPDKWGVLAQEPDFNWSPSRVVDICTSRTAEPAVGYLESHDQCLVGDKTFAFRLMDGAMYECMGKKKPSHLTESDDWSVHPAIERGVALHKIARLLTLTLSGEAWMNFMGNEFGHPEWVDFPREGNGESFQHARRQWTLRDINGAGKDLFYADLEKFDGELMKTDTAYGLLVANINEEVKHAHHIKDDAGVLAFHCGNNLIVANLHPHESYPYYKVGSAFGGRYKLVLDTDSTEFGGYGRLDKATTAETEGGACDWQATGVCLYLPSRSAQIYTLDEEWNVPDDLYSVHHDNDFGYGYDEELDTGGGATTPCGFNLFF